MAAANAVGFCMQFVSTAVTVLVAIWLQEGLRVSALSAGLALLPMTLPVTVAAPLAGRWVPRFGARRLVITGTVAVAVGTAAIGAGALSRTLRTGDPRAGPVRLRLRHGAHGPDHRADGRRRASWTAGWCPASTTPLATSGPPLGSG